MKKIQIVIVILAVLALFLIAANEWPARLNVKNQTEANVIISLEYPYTWLVVPAGENREFHIEKGVYDAQVTACGETVTGTMNLKHNLKLNFTPCSGWANTSADKFPGEPALEKPNWNRPPKANYWRFQY